MTPVIIGDATLYLGDCQTILPTLTGIDCILTDPPYGIKRDKGFEGFGGFGAKIARKKYSGDWDSERPHKDCFTHILNFGKTAIIFGGQFFADYLPVNGHWLVWDKLNTMPTFGDCELAWTNVKRNSVKKITVEYNGLIGKEESREHSTQKPVNIMSYCVIGYTKEQQVICDPFMGSGTTGIACIRHGRKFIGIEKDPAYFDIAVKRITTEQSQLRLDL